MSNFEQTDGTILLEATADGPFTEIHVLNSDLHPERLVFNLGEAQARLPRGLYALRFQAGHALTEQLVVLTRDEQVPMAEPLNFAAIAPLRGTVTCPAVHADALDRLLAATPLCPAGNSAQDVSLLLFVRDIEPGPSNCLARGLKLHSLDGRLLVDVERAGLSDVAQGWAGCRLRLPPGDYRLRLATEENNHLERALPLCSGWQTLVFFLARSFGGDRRADFARSSLLLFPAEQAIDLNHDWCRWTELALQALEGERSIPRSSRPLAKLGGNPLLLLLEAHLQLRQKILDKDFPTFLWNLWDQLHSQLGSHPDVVALGHELARGPLKDDPNLNRALRGFPPLSLPPLLGASWQFLLRADRDAGQIFAPGTLTARCGSHCRSAGSWLVWWSGERDEAPWPPTPATAAETLSGPELRQLLQEALNALVEKLHHTPRWPVLLQSERLPAIGQTLIRAIFPAADPTVRHLLEQEDSPLTQKLKESLPTQLDVDAVLEVCSLCPVKGLQVARALVEELNRLAGFEVIRQAVEDRTALAALRRCHRPCQQVVLFDDFCQEVLLRALQHADTLRAHSRSQLLAWLQAIGRQLAVDYLRRTRRGTEPLPENLADRDVALTPQEAERREEIRVRGAGLVDLFAELTPPERELLFRRYFRNESLADIARDLGVSQNTLNKRHERLRKRLQERISLPGKS